MNQNFEDAAQEQRAVALRYELDSPNEFELDSPNER